LFNHPEVSDGGRIETAGVNSEPLFFPGTHGGRVSALWIIVSCE
jgi:hypothetical protein